MPEFDPGAQRIEQEGDDHRFSEDESEYAQYAQNDIARLSGPDEPYGLTEIFAPERGKQGQAEQDKQNGCVQKSFDMFFLQRVSSRTLHKINA